MPAFPRAGCARPAASPPSVGSPGASSARNPPPLETFRVFAAGRRVMEGFRWLPRGTAEIIPQGLLFKPTGAFTFAWWKSIQKPREPRGTRASCGQAVTRARGIGGAARLKHGPAKHEGEKGKGGFRSEPRCCRQQRPGLFSPCPVVPWPLRLAEAWRGRGEALASLPGSPALASCMTCSRLGPAWAEWC